MSLNTLEMDAILRGYFFKSGKYTLPYRQGIFNADQEGDFAVVFFLHGAGERGSDNVKTPVHFCQEIVEYLDVHPFKCIVLVPQCPENEKWVNTPWEAKTHSMDAKPTKSIQYALNLLDEKVKEFKADRNRIYVCGISMGGYASWDVLCRRPDFFAAGLVCCGGADCRKIRKLANVPLRFTHGTLDSVVPVENSRNIATTLKKCGNTVFTYTEIPDCNHGVWEQTYRNPDNFNWLFSQKRK